MDHALLVNRLKKIAKRELFDPDISRALLITIALVVPLIIAHQAGRPALGVFVAMTAQLMVSARIGGSYREKALVLLTGTICFSIAAFAGTLAGAQMWSGILFMSLLAAIAALIRGIADYGQIFGISAVILGLISLHEPHLVASAELRAILVATGGVWASVLILFPWLIDAHRPFYISLAKPWYLSAFTMELVAKENVPEETSQQIFSRTEINLRKSINDVLPWLRTKRKETALIRRESLKIVRSASRFGVTALSIHFELEELKKREINPMLISSIQVSLVALGDSGDAVTTAILTQKKSSAAFAMLKVCEAEQKVNKVSKYLAENKLQEAVEILLARIVVLLEASLSYLRDSLLHLKRMEMKRNNGNDSIVRVNYSYWFNKGLKNIKLQLQPESLIFQHGMRALIITAVGMLFYYVLDIPRGYWIILTIMVLLQPDFGNTFNKAKDRLSGTFLGVILGSALLISSLSVHFLFLIAAIAISCFFFVYFQPKNYKLAVVFITIMLVAMLDVAEHIDWHVAMYRLIATAIGGVLAVSASYFLWPNWETLRFPSRMAKAIQANKNYLLQIGKEIENRSGFNRRVMADRRKAEVENMNTMESLKYLYLEPARLRRNLKNANRMAELNRKLTRSLTAFSAFLPKLKNNQDMNGVSILINNCALVLDQLALAIQEKVKTSDTTALETILEKAKSEHFKKEGSEKQLKQNELFTYAFIDTELVNIAEEIKGMVSLLSSNEV